MKIGLVRRGYSSSGGAEAYLLRLASALVAAGNELTLFSDTEWPDSALAQAGATLRQVTLREKGPLKFARRFERGQHEFAQDLFLSLERVFSCDVFRAGDGVHAAWLQRRAEYEPRWKRLVRHFNRKHAGILRLEQKLLAEGGAKRVIANSKLVRDEIVAHYRFPAEKIDVVYNGVPAITASPDARARLRAELGLDADAYVALFVGSGWERKGLSFAIRSVQGVRPLQLLVAGRGREHSASQVRFLGPRRDIPDLLAAADVFILPTIYDPFSNASLEALSAGLPVITTAANGCSEIISPGVHGTVVDRSDNVAALIDALQQWEDPKLRAETFDARKSLAAGFSVSRNLDETVAVLKRAAKP